jgi:hypothetical protein
METLRANPTWKIAIVMLLVLTCLFIFLVALASSQAGDSAQAARDQALLKALAAAKATASESEDAHKFLHDFMLVPGSAVLVDDHHVLALYKNQEKDFYAVLLFSVDCDRTGCTPNELLAFSIVDSDGQDIQLA